MAQMLKISICKATIICNGALILIMSEFIVSEELARHLEDKRWEELIAGDKMNFEDVVVVKDLTPRYRPRRTMVSIRNRVIFLLKTSSIAEETTDLAQVYPPSVKPFQDWLKKKGEPIITLL